jgi:hypothetical protein
MIFSPLVRRGERAVGRAFSAVVVWDYPFPKIVRILVNLGVFAKGNAADVGLSV